MKVGTLTSSDDSGGMRRGVVKMQGRTDAKTVLHTPYGLMHNPPPGSFVPTYQQMGLDSNLIGIADDPKSRPLTALKTWEVAIGNYKTRSWVLWRDDGTIEVSSENDVIVTKATNVTVNASATTTVNCPSITLNGNVTIAGTLTQTGGGAASFSGDITTTGNVTTPADVVASGISLNSHLHSGVTPGGGNTGGPV